jgi:integrase
MYSASIFYTVKIKIIAMPKHTENALTDRKILNAKSKDKQYKIFDGKGLFVLIHPNGSKYFRWEYKYEGKRKTLALGIYPETTLRHARDERLKARKLVHEGSDPVKVRRMLKSEKKLELKAERGLDQLSFENVAMEWWKRQSLNQTEKHAREARRSLENHVFPHIGFKRIDEITTKEVKSLLLDLEGQGKGETSHRVQQRLRSVFQYAIMQEWTDRNPASDLHKLLNPVKKQQMKALPLKEFPNYLQRLDEDNLELHLITRAALKLIVMLFVRTRELIEAKWEEVDLESATWRIPAERMKLRVEHLVPLPNQALSLFQDLQKITGESEFVFPGDRNPKQPMSNNTLLYGGIYRMGLRSRATIHGFRSLASSILNESGKWNPDAIERQLAHSEKDQVRAAYNRANYLDERRRMMQWYADYLDEIKLKEK